MNTKWILILALLLAVGCGSPDADVAVKVDSDTATPSTADLDVGLEVGNLAPEIEGVELGGTTMKLSDYRGKVVLLDFWGDW